MSSLRVVGILLLVGVAVHLIGTIIAKVRRTSKPCEPKIPKICDELPDTECTKEVCICVTCEWKVACGWCPNHGCPKYE